MQGTGRNKQHEWCVGCTDLAGHEHHLIVFDDRVGLVVVFPPDAWAVLTLPQAERLRAALTASVNDGDG